MRIRRMRLSAGKMAIDLIGSTWGVLVCVAILCGCSTTASRDFYPKHTAKGTILFTGRVDDGGHKIELVRVYQIIDGEKRYVNYMGLAFGPYLLPADVRECLFTALPGKETFHVQVGTDNVGLAIPESSVRARYFPDGIPIAVDVYDGLTTRVTLVLHDRSHYVGSTWVKYNFLVEVTDPVSGKIETGQVVVTERGIRVEKQ